MTDTITNPWNILSRGYIISITVLGWDQCSWFIWILLVHMYCVLAGRRPWCSWKCHAVLTPFLWFEATGLWTHYVIVIVFIVWHFQELPRSRTCTNFHSVLRQLCVLCAYVHASVSVCLSVCLSVSVYTCVCVHTHVCVHNSILCVCVLAQYVSYLCVYVTLYLCVCVCV